MNPLRAKRRRVEGSGDRVAGAVDGYQPQLDGLRTLAVAVVLAYHAALPLATGGYVGVDVFFVLSGYLITSLLIRERAAGGGIGLRRFYGRRIRRLVPALFVMLAVTFLAYWLAAPPVHTTSETLIGVPASVFYVANWLPALGITNLGFLGHMWSLSVEEHFYLLWPMLLGALWTPDRRRLTRRVGAATVVAALYRVALVARGTGMVRLYAGTDARAEELLVGCLLAVVLAGDATAVWRSGRRRAAVTAAAIVGAAVLAAVVAFVPVGSRVLRFGGATAVELAAAAIVAHLVVAPRSVGARLLGTRPMVWAGKRSYGIYLWHLPLAGLAAGLVPVNSLDVRLLSIAAVWSATVACAALSYRYVERPALRRTRQPDVVLDLRADGSDDGEHADQAEQAVPAQRLARAV